MTVTAIHPPTKALDLDAVVRSAAVLNGAGIVGMITAGPAKLALLQMAGGGGPVIDLAVESPQDLALLSRDVAVVRAGDGSLWAIGDLHGTPRAKLVGRDARALVMRPQGESALALNQDGSAGAITLSKQEVSLRPFAVRGGALRACCVAESVTYVVVDGEGGGQLRIHPGTTPEPGTSVKATLPAEAKELDQVRGGMALSAVYKRGSSTICLITGGPSKLAPKMAELDGKPADIAVLEDALLVAFADGRVALYDGAAIAGAGSALLTATASLAPPARGKPRVAVVAGTAKIPHAFWIGTTSGEVLRAVLARDGERVEEVPAAKPAPPREDPRAAEIAALKQALAESEAAREAEAVRARSLEESQAAAGVSDEERAAYAGALEALKSEHAAALEAQKAEHASLLDGLKAEHASRIDGLKAEHASQLDGLKAEHAQALEAQRIEHASAIEALKAEHAAALEALTADRTAAQEAQKAERAALEAQKTEHATAFAWLAKDHAAALDALKAEHESAIDAQQAGHEAALEAERTARAGAEDTLKGAHSAELAAEKTAYAGLIAEREALVAAKHAEVEAARREIAALTARAAAAEERVTQKTREHVELGAELDALRAELAEARAKQDGDFVKWGDKTVSLDKARGAVDTLLTRAQGVFGKRGGRE